MNSLEQKVQSVILGLNEASNIKKSVQFRQPAGNIGTQLLEQFDEESDGDDKSLEAPTQLLPQPMARSKNWGPVVAPRVSARIRRDGRTAIQKAEDLKRLKDLEVPKGDTEEDCRLLLSMEDPMQGRRKRARGAVHSVSVGGCQKTTTAALARARLRKRELWLQYSVRKAGGWMGVDNMVVLEG